MRRRQLPEVWYFTDVRAGDALWAALDRLPRGGGVVFRHGELAPQARAALLTRVRAVARRRRLVLVVRGSASRAGEGVHLARGDRRRHRGLVTAAAHDRAELVRAARCGAALVFVSPVFATRSHPNARCVGRVRFGLLVRRARVAVAALGGMTPRRYTALRPLGAAGWGGIDAWGDPRQKL